MNDFSRVLQILKSRRTERFAMATVIGVKGSSYRNEGAKMLIDEKGKFYGMISGGCLEEDIIHHANEVLQFRKPKMVTYDHTSERDLSWGPWSGCNGIIYVYIEETGWDILKDKMGKSLWEIIDHTLLLGHRVVSLKKIDGENDNKDRIYYFSDGDILFGLDDLENSLLTYLNTFIAHEKKQNSSQSGIKDFWLNYISRKSHYIYLEPVPILNHW